MSKLKNISECVCVRESCPQRYPCVGDILFYMGVLYGKERVGCACYPYVY